MTVVVKRSALRMWLISIAAIPLLVISFDVLTNRRITNWLREIIFTPQDTQIYEPRDVIWAWAMALFAGVLVLWGLKELLVPTKVVECDDRGLSLKVKGPFRPPVVIPWDQLVDVTGDEVEDEGTTVPLMVVEVRSRGDLPPDPWGARWIGDNKLGVVAEDWSDDPAAVADQIGDCAVEAAKRETRGPTAQLWEES